MTSEVDYLSWITREQQDQLITEMIHDGVLREEDRRGLIKNGVFNEDMRGSVFGAIPRGANIYDLYNTRERELNNWDDSWQNETGIKLKPPQWFQEKFPEIPHFLEKSNGKKETAQRSPSFQKSQIQTRGDAEHLLEFEPELKKLAEIISSKNGALNASLKLLNFIHEHVDLTNLKQNEEYLQL